MTDYTLVSGMTANKQQGDTYMKLTNDEMRLLEIVRENPEIIPYALRLAEEFQDKPDAFPARYSDMQKVT